MEVVRMGIEFFRIESTPQAAIVDLRLPEAIDSTEFDALNDALTGAIASSPLDAWVIDLSAVSYMGSAMLGLMVNVRQQIKSRNGRLVLCAMHPRLLDIFRTCCMERLFTIVRTRAEALK
ncbi:MAG: STAS domain-containing protein [Tepidisphaeraceae bacterium]